MIPLRRRFGAAFTHDDGDTVEDWRIALADDVNGTRGLTPRWAPRRVWDERWDHDHCAACGAKLSEDPALGLAEGYASVRTAEHDERWHRVCPTCFDELAGEMDWRKAVAPAP